MCDALAYPAKAKPEHSHGARFFSAVRDLTATGFFTSKIGIADLDYKGNTFVRQVDRRAEGGPRPSRRQLRAARQVVHGVDCQSESSGSNRVAVDLSGRRDCYRPRSSDAVRRSAGVVLYPACCSAFPLPLSAWARLPPARCCSRRRPRPRRTSPRSGPTSAPAAMAPPCRARRRRACSTTHGSRATATMPSLAATIKNGRVATGMPAFGTLLNDEEIRAMVVYIRETAGKAKAAGAGYAAPAANVVVQSEKHAFKLETVRRGRDRAVGPGLPARRPDADHREGRRAAHRRRQGRARRRARAGRAGGVVEGPGRPARRRRCIPTTRRTAGSTSPTATRARTTRR